MQNIHYVDGMRVKSLVLYSIAGLVGHNRALTSVTGKGSQPQETNFTLCSMPECYKPSLHMDRLTYHGHQYNVATNALFVHTDGAVLHQ